MNSNSILKSHLLDIIFENRNKEYGAYVLRRDYNKRLTQSLLGMFLFAAMFAAWILYHSKPAALAVQRIIEIADPQLQRVPQIPKEPQLIQPAVAQQRHATVPDAPPVIAPDITVTHVVPTTQQILTGDPGNVISDGPPSDGPGGGDGGKPSTGFIAPAPPTPPKPKPEIVTSPEIPAQYPGGISEFIKFLKRNLHAPEDLQDEAVISVKVKFIVSLNGDLLGFNVVETGGEAFDNEVIRVLKKMPKWIPGKSNGENVSSYYVIPVKFTPEK